MFAWKNMARIQGTTKAPDARATRGVNLSFKISIHPSSKASFSVFRVQSTSLNDNTPSAFLPLTFKCEYLAILLSSWVIVAIVASSGCPLGSAWRRVIVSYHFRELIADFLSFSMREIVHLQTGQVCLPVHLDAFKNIDTTPTFTIVR